MTLPTTLADCSVVALAGPQDGLGAAGSFEATDQVPFPVARLTHPGALPEGATWGGYALRETSQFLVVLDGAFEVTLHDGTAQSVQLLEGTRRGLGVPPGIWMTLQSRSPGSKVLVLASAADSEGDAFREFEGFRQWKVSLVSPFPLVANGIAVRPYTLADAPAFAASAQASVEAVGRWLEWSTPAFDEGRAERYIRQASADWAARKAYSFGIFSAGVGGQHLGGIALNRLDWRGGCGNLGYWVATSATGKGVCSTAATLVCRHAFGVLGFRRIEVLVVPGNEGSRRVAMRLGARSEGVQRARVLLGGKPADIELLSVLRDEFTGL